jgi:hypothetical protein
MSHKTEMDAEADSTDSFRTAPDSEEAVQLATETDSSNGCKKTLGRHPKTTKTAAILIIILGILVIIADIGILINTGIHMNTNITGGGSGNESDYKIASTQAPLLSLRLAKLLTSHVFQAHAGECRPDQKDD